MDKRAKHLWHIIYNDENRMPQRTADYPTREAVLAKACFLGRTCEIVLISDAAGHTIDPDELIRQQVQSELLDDGLQRKAQDGWRV